MTRGVAVVLEWETVLEGKAARGMACLASLKRQLAEMTADDTAFETVICFDPAHTTEESLRVAATSSGTWPGSLLLAPVTGDYYQKKNQGFMLTTGHIVIFVDSDLIPEPDWLRNMIQPFADFRKSIVVGRTHLETSTLYERAVALFWIFEARDSSIEPRLTRRLVSNNIAFRRAVFARFPFPERPTFRGQCGELGSTLEAIGIAMYEQPAARASHPAPDGLSRFVTRAWHAGKDHAFYDTANGLFQCLRNLRTDLRHVRERIATRRSIIGATSLDVLAAHALGVTYYAIKVFGYATSVRRGIAGVPESAPAVRLAKS